jgi:hypothetical protein
MFTDHEPTGTGKPRWHLERALAALARDVEAPMITRTADGAASRHPEPGAALRMLLDLERAAVLAQTEQISRARARRSGLRLRDRRPRVPRRAAGPSTLGCGLGLPGLRPAHHR